MINFREDWIDLVVEVTDAGDLNGMTGTVFARGSAPHSVLIDLGRGVLVDLHVARIKRLPPLKQLAAQADENS